MRACTAVITEVSYHAKSTIEADISFLTMGEWRTEIDVLLQDIKDPDYTTKKDMEAAWAKV